MNSIRALHAKHHGENGIVNGVVNSMRLNSEIRDVFQEAEETDSREEDGIDVDEEASSGTLHDEEWQTMCHLANVLFSPGSKFIGAIQVPTSSSSSTQVGQASQSHINRDLKSYELVVMESDEFDEMGNQKGILCRHKIRGDEQCIYLKVRVVPVVCAGLDAVSLDKHEDVTSLCNNDTTKKVDLEIDSNVTQVEPQKSIQDKIPLYKHTIQIEYYDGEILCQGHWDHKTLRFSGTVKILSARCVQTNPMERTIIGGLIGGRSGGGNPENDEDILERRKSSIKETSQFHSFFLSPCTHNNPRGINPVQLHTPIESPEMENVITATTTKNIDHSLIDEILTPDNFKLILHRARTAVLCRETLTKLVDLGGYINFSQLARKRNDALRREKWKSAITRFKPKIPLFRSRRSTSFCSDDQSKVDKKMQFYDHLAAISWIDLLEESSIQSEKVCAVFRRRVILLNSLTFQSDECKVKIMTHLRDNGLSLLNSHSEWDKCIQMGRTITLGWSWFEKGSWSCFGWSAVVGRRCVHILFQMHSRLESNHNRLEKAYRKADGRLTVEQLDRITLGNRNPDETEQICGICQCEMDESDESAIDQNDRPMFLICSHGFHSVCIREWLHNNASCPVCRFDFNLSP